VFNRKAVFFDRDGTVIESVHRPNFPENSPDKKEITAPFLWDELKLIPDAFLAVYRFREHGFLRILVTNQPDVAHGYMDETVWQKIQGRVENIFGFDVIKICRHRSVDNCPNKKPLPGMLFSAADDKGIDLKNSFMVGDTDSDMKAGRSAGCRVVLVDRFYNSELPESEYDYRAQSLTEAVAWILDQEERA